MAPPSLEIDKRCDRIEQAIIELAETVSDVDPSVVEEIKRILKHEKSETSEEKIDRN